jgi:murein DD-endopeptidase MepM/ murein hydrolase activator NlpD
VKLSSGNTQRDNKYSAKSGFRPWRTIFLVLLGAAAIIGTAAALNGRVPAVEERAAIDWSLVSPVRELAPGPFQTALDRRDSLEMAEDSVDSGETLSHIMERLGLNRTEARYVTDTVAETLDLTKVRPGAKVRVYRDRKTAEPVRLEYRLSPEKPRLVIERTPTGYAAGWEEYAPICLTEAAAGRIKTTLWGAAVQVHKLDPELVMTFADLFAYDVDFFTDIQEGDEFGILFDREYCQGRLLGPGRIHSAYFVNRGKKFELFQFANAEGEDGFFDAKGNSRKKMFLKTPLQYRRISSHFSKSRMHPILKYRRPHLGVDYTAATGTPVETVASGEVTFAGWKGGYGNIVIVKHNKEYTTQYAHLSRFPKGLKKGQKVQQGDLIGYVGSTGLSTGPHLDFRMTKGGDFVDPLVELAAQAAVPLSDADKSKFFEQVELRRAEMSRLLAEF